MVKFLFVEMVILVVVVSISVYRFLIRGYMVKVKLESMFYGES